MGKTMSPPFLDPILFVLAGQIGPHTCSFIFYQIIIKVADNQGRHKSSDEFDFGPDQTTHFGVTCPWMTKILYFRTWISLRPVGQSWSNFMCSITAFDPILFILVCCLHASSFIFDWIIIKVAGNQDGHKSLVEFEFGPKAPIDL